MNKSDLIRKIQLALDNNSEESNFSIDPNIEKFLDALVVFESKSSQEIFLKTFEALKNSILEQESDYTVRKNAKFGSPNFAYRNGANRIADGHNREHSREPIRAPPCKQRKSPNEIRINMQKHREYDHFLKLLLFMSTLVLQDHCPN